MRTHGHLKKWNDDRGFGFIVRPQNDFELFVHISAFPKDGVRPKVGELISFEIQRDKNGKKRAIRVQRTELANSRPKRGAKISSDAGFPFKGSLVIIMALVLVYVAYKSNLPFQNSQVVPFKKMISTPKPVSQQFECDGRQYCGDMRSRAEAEYFITHCPDTKMDGDGDGIPCENDSRF